MERYRFFEELAQQLLLYAQVLLAKNLTITRKTANGLETILQTLGDTITRTTVTAHDLERFAQVV